MLRNDWYKLFGGNCILLVIYVYVGWVTLWFENWINIHTTRSIAAGMLFSTLSRILDVKIIEHLIFSRCYHCSKIRQPLFFSCTNNRPLDKEKWWTFEFVICTVYLCFTGLKKNLLSSNCQTKTETYIWNLIICQKTL